MFLLSLTVEKFIYSSTYGKLFTYIARLSHVYKGEETAVLYFPALSLMLQDSVLLGTAVSLELVVRKKNPFHKKPRQIFCTFVTHICSGKEYLYFSEILSHLGKHPNR